MSTHLFFPLAMNEPFCFYISVSVVVDPYGVSFALFVVAFDFHGFSIFVVGTPESLFSSTGVYVASFFYFFCLVCRLRLFPSDLQSRSICVYHRLCLVCRFCRILYFCFCRMYASLRLWRWRSLLAVGFRLCTVLL